jgi:hypothetical protein
MMRARPALAVFALLLAATPAVAAHHATTHGFPNALLIAAAKAAPLKPLDGSDADCDGDTSIATWLKRLTAAQARSTAWSAGPCELINANNPLDAGGAYCVQANVTLKHPKDRRDRPVLEIYLEDPKRGRPGRGLRLPRHVRLQRRPRLQPLPQRLRSRMARTLPDHRPWLRGPDSSR